MITRKRVIAAICVNELIWLTIGIAGWQTIRATAINGSWVAVALIILAPAILAFYAGRKWERRNT